MGQRSQIFVRYNKEEGKKHIIARYYQWNFAERMISRARYGMGWIHQMVKEFPNYYIPSLEEKLYRILDTNFDMIDCVKSTDIIEEYRNEMDDSYHVLLNAYLFKRQGNNDGKLLIDILEDGTLKYAFLDYDNNKIMSGSEYMRWDLGVKWKIPNEYLDEEDINTCIDNIKSINKLAKKMTKEEVDEYLNYNYEYSMGFEFTV
jgi:hypothetical protein